MLKRSRPGRSSVYSTSELSAAHWSPVIGRDRAALLGERMTSPPRQQLNSWRCRSHVIPSESSRLNHHSIAIGPIMSLRVVLKMLKFHTGYRMRNVHQNAPTKNHILAPFRTTSRLDLDYPGKATKYCQSVKKALQTTITPVPAHVSLHTSVQKRRKIGP